MGAKNGVHPENDTCSHHVEKKTKSIQVKKKRQKKDKYRQEEKRR